MNVTVNQLIDIFATNQIVYTDCFTATVYANSRDVGRTTNYISCGIVIPLEGSAHFKLGQRSFEAGVGKVIHAGLRMDLDIRAGSESFTYAVIHYKALDMNYPLLHSSFILPLQEWNALYYLVNQLLEHEKIPGNMYRVKCRSLFYQVIEQLLYCAKVQVDVSDSNIVEYAVSFLSTQFRNHISIQQMSEVLQCDRRRLTYLFEKELGISPIQFLTEMRIKHAQNMLRTTDLGIGQIGEAVGYPDPFYFSKVFKKNIGVTPTAYRDQFIVR